MFARKPILKTQLLTGAGDDPLTKIVNGVVTIDVSLSLLDLLKFGFCFSSIANLSRCWLHHRGFEITF